MSRRSHIVGLFESDDEIKDREDEVIAHRLKLDKVKRRAEQKHELWEAGFEMRKVRWNARVDLIFGMMNRAGEAISIAGSNLPLYILMFMLCALAGFCLLWLGAGMFLYADPLPTESYYIKKSTVRKQSPHEVYAVYEIIGGVLTSNVAHTDALYVDDAHTAFEAIKAQYPNREFYLSNRGEQTECWYVAQRVRGSDEKVSDCYLSYEDARADRDRFNYPESFSYPQTESSGAAATAPDPSVPEALRP